MTATITVRPELPADVSTVRSIHRAAFDGPDEAAIVDALRANCPDEVLSLVATEDGEVVAHAMFSPASIGAVQGMGLAPMAVAPARQRRGIGSTLLARALDLLRDRTPFIIVLGHPAYYPRFGFTPAADRSIRCAFPDVPREAFMILINDDAAMRHVTGVAHYRPELEA